MVPSRVRVVRRVAGAWAVALLAATGAIVLPPPAMAEEPVTPTSDEVPSGFTDGDPVAGAPTTSAPPTTTSTTTSPTTTSTPTTTTSPTTTTTTTSGAPLAPEVAADAKAAPQRYFGRGPWEAIQASAAAAARPCRITDNGVTAMVVSPVFKESSAALTRSTAPSPMTLSRYDEWNGTYATTSNKSANYGLYAFRNPNTAYKRAFWHPGIGIWQYDSAGVGAPFTAVERMDVRVTSADVAKGMVARYCNPSPSIVGHGPPYTDLERRYSAWWPWTYPCTLCEQEFQAMTSTATDFSKITLVDGISATGGAKQRTCTLSGVTGTIPCWYVDPSVGTIEGSTGWAQITPLDGGNPSSTPTPLAEPFYVIDRGATEERHWLRADTGYSIDISGTRNIGTNERPRSTQSGSGITWRSGSGLCDLTAGRGACLPPAPSGMALSQNPVSGTYRPIALDAQGDGQGDVLWYAPGASSDSLWLGNGSGTFTSRSVSVSSTYHDVLPLDVDGDGDDDILWYNRSTGAAYLWGADGSGAWRSVKLSRPKGLRPLVVDPDDDGRDDIFWYGPGTLPDALWSWNGALFTSRAQSVGGTYLPLVGDFDGNRKQDIFWYASGAAADHLWLSTGRGTHVDRSISIGGTYVPLVGDFDGDRNDDILWYGPGRGADNLFFGAAGGNFVRRTVSVSGTYQPKVADLGGDGRDDVIWYAPGAASDAWWRWTSGRTQSSAGLIAQGSHQPVVGRFSRGGTDGILWYAAGPTPDGVWYR